jgi:hypothetical protein
MNSILTIFIGGREMNIHTLQQVDFLADSKILAEIGIGAKIGKIKIPTRKFNLLGKNIEISESIETSIWTSLKELKTIKNRLVDNKVETITFLIRIRNQDFVDFAVTKKMFSIHVKISVAFKFSIEIPQEILLAVENPKELPKRKSEKRNEREDRIITNTNLDPSELLRFLKKHSVEIALANKIMTFFPGRVLSHTEKSKISVKRKK